MEGDSIVCNDRLESIIERMVEIQNSERNKLNKQLWKDQPAWGRDCWRGIPIRNDLGIGPITVDPEKQVWAHTVGFDISKYWVDPDVHLEARLKMNIHKFESYKDNTYFPGDISPWFGVVFELSMFGFDIIWREDRDPWIGGGPILKEYEDLEKLQHPDFYKSGLMPKVHEFYQAFRERVGDRIDVVFPDWVRGPFCLAMHLRGMESLLMDMYENPDWVHKLMRFLTDSHKIWSTERAKFTGKPIVKGKLYNDEIDCPTISPKVYKEFILPYEKEISEFHGGITYFHSCGNLTPFLADIKTIPNLDIVHVSPWTNLDEALKALPPEVTLDICVDPARDVIQATEEQMRSKLEDIVAKCRRNEKAAFSIRADALEIINDFEYDNAKINKWCEVAREITNQQW